MNQQQDVDCATQGAFWRDWTLDAISHFPEESVMRRRPRRAILFVLATSAGFRMTTLYRFGRTMRAIPVVGHLISKFCFWLGCLIYKCSLASTARIGGGLILPHPQGIVIGADAVIGPRTWIFQNVTIGGMPGKIGLPVIGADARVYAGAVICGLVRVGDGS